MKKINSFLFISFIIITLTLESCTKEAGEGGNSSIYGSVWVKDYDNTFTVLNGEYVAADEDVYIIYGDDYGYSDHIKTDYNGNYVFKYLRKGKYTIYTYSKDSTLQNISGEIAIVEEIEITKLKQEVEVPMFTIYK
ncbi:MAG TPA: hypothetical protein DDX39_07775 [Bacteroidales bacterium]|nr:MAG: hypothetical protein A2W98_14340 [Bacteroidetes bacterium GWF2_33_38]OFY74909.1 MAG: hypothetical protein A2265_10280 [Bacteroidetes bacterium RIFOXYA12_FULL_33_9]OFY90442.1 MAG: hypothetical protein A2236_11010 [Bacteroidetes bacterium RIFOXYA2_FULL_33_7]HBF88524.1 hypothetical protein [Bacteroidales bacterium]